MKLGAENIRDIDVGIGRIEAFQPRLTVNGLAEGLLHTEDPLLLHGLSNLVRVWANLHPDLPNAFAEGMTVTEASRQPLGWTTVEAQEVQRSFQEVDEPFQGEAIDTRPFRTQDPYELAPLAPAVFPPQPMHEQFNVAGQESVAQCATCEGAGAAPCSTCSGVGTVLCTQCGGARTLTCSRCQGAGRHQGVSGRIINCQLCNTRGTLSCRNCSSGRSQCSDCAGSGEISCNRCAGLGSMKKRWTVVSETRTNVLYRPFLHEPWPHLLEQFRGQGDELNSQVWILPHRHPAQRPSGDFLPSAMAVGHKQLIDQGLLPQAQSAARVSGLRVRILGTYAYRLGIEYKGRKGRLFVVGASNQVLIDTLPTSRLGWFGKFLETTQRKLSTVDMADFVGLPPEFITGVRAGTVHIADSICLVARAAAHLGVPCQITADGYSLALRIGSGGDPPIILQTAIEYNHNKQWILRTTCQLGPVYRERAPQALAYNTRLTFGRIAIVTNQDSIGESFELVDIRPYEQTRSEHLARIIQYMALDVAELRRSRILA